MKVLNKILSAILISTVLFIGSCKEDPPSPAEQVQTKLTEITGIYTVNSVTLDGNDVSSDYPGMSITLGTTKTYETSPGDYEPVWLSSGKFIFKDETSDPPVLTSFIRDDDVEVAYQLSGSSMSFSFNVPNPFGRGAGIDGTYVFQCTKL